MRHHLTETSPTAYETGARALDTFRGYAAFVTHSMDDRTPGASDTSKQTWSVLTDIAITTAALDGQRYFSGDVPDITRDQSEEVDNLRLKTAYDFLHHMSGLDEAVDPYVQAHDPSSRLSLIAGAQAGLTVWSNLHGFLDTAQYPQAPMHVVHEALGRGLVFDLPSEVSGTLDEYKHILGTPQTDPAWPINNYTVTGTNVLPLPHAIDSPGQPAWSVNPEAFDYAVRAVLSAAQLRTFY